MRQQLLFWILLILVISRFEVSAQNNKVDSLKKILSQQTLSTDKISTQIKLYELNKRADAEIAQSHLVSAQKLLHKSIPDSITAQLWTSYAELQLLQHQYDSAFYYLDKGFLLHQLTSKNKIALYSLQGTTFYYKGDFKKAIESHLQAEKFCTPSKKDIGTARVYNNIGIAHIKLEQWDKAEEFMQKSLAICKELETNGGISYVLGNLGIIYKNQDKNETAIEIYKQSIALHKKTNDRKGLARNYSNLGSLWEKQESLDSANLYYNKALELATELDDNQSKALAFHNLGSIQSKLNQFKNAQKSYETSLELAKSLEDLYLQKNIYFGMSEMFEQQGRISDAYKNRKIYEEINDSLVKINNLKSINELEIKYETANKEKAILELTAKQLRNEASIQSQKNKIKQITIGFAALVILLLMLGFLFQQYTRNKKQRELLVAIDNTQMEERKRIAQDLHDSVGGTLAFAKNKLISITELKPELNNDLTDFLISIEDSENQIRQISHNLMPSELVKFGLVSAVKNILDKINSPKLSTQLYTHNLTNRIDATKEIHIYRIIQEIIQNILKHADASLIEVHLLKKQNYLSLMIEDDGVGYNLNNDSDGIGLQNIKNRIQLLNGHLKIDSIKGTTFNIQIPLV